MRAKPGYISDICLTCQEPPPLTDSHELTNPLHQELHLSHLFMFYLKREVIRTTHNIVVLFPLIRL